MMRLNSLLRHLGQKSMRKVSRRPWFVRRIGNSINMDTTIPTCENENPNLRAFDSFAGIMTSAETMSC